MNKLILAATAVAAVTVTTGCKHTVVRTVHHPVEVIDSRTVVHEHTDVHIHEHREPPRIVEEVRVIRPQPIYVPVPSGHREPERHSHEPAHPAPPAHSNSRHNREAEAPRSWMYHSRERVEEERRERPAPVVIPPRTIRRQPVQPVIHPVPSDRPQHREREQEQRQERRAPVNTPARNDRRPPLRPALPATAGNGQRGHGPAQPSQGRPQDNPRRDAAHDNGAGEQEGDSTAHPSSRAAERGKERSAQNRRD